MDISQDTEKALEFLDYMSGGNLRKRNDIGLILELGATYGESNLVNDIIFYGSACWNLSLTLKKETGRENESKLKTQFDELLSQLRDYLAVIAEKGDEEVRKRFRDIYLSLTAGTVKNLMDLSYDLAQLKSLQKQLKDKAKA